MKALLIAGGPGTRLRPLTFTRPKHLLPIANRAHIEHVFALVQGYGVDEVVLLTSYLAAAFEGVIRRAEEDGLRVKVAHEDEPLGTAGALKNAQRMAGDSTFLAFNGDVLTDVDLGAVIEFHKSRNALGTIVLTPVDDPSAYGVVPTDDDGKVLGFIEKPVPGEAQTNSINAGVYVLEPAVLERIPAGAAFSAERELFPLLVEEGVLYATSTDAYWMDIGTPAKYLQANLDALRGRYVTDAVVDPGPATAVVHEAAFVASEARVSSACIGARSKVGPGATIVESVLLDGCVVGDGATARRCVLGEGVVVSPGVELVGETLADRERR